jgi:hypothetical protein
VIDPVLDTADFPELTPGHRAAASNALCAFIEACQGSKSVHVRNEIFDDSVWLRLFNIYLRRSEDAKGKSMRQMLLVFTSVITNVQSAQADTLRKRASSTFLDIICGRQDRIKVKPALQGLAHFVLRDVVSLTQLVELHEELSKRSSARSEQHSSVPTLLRSFLAWIVHHDTSLSAGHLVRNFLLQARKLPDYWKTAGDNPGSPLWIGPVVRTLQLWPDRLQEFQTHVFPHCFLPNIEEYTCFLSHLNFGMHVKYRGSLPPVLQSSNEPDNGISTSEEFKILLAAIEGGKELNIIRDNGKSCQGT